VNNSRRKIAVALHNLGDGIQPRDDSPVREDISMTEECGEAARERRRIAREEILQRGALLEARRRKRQSSSLGSFDSLVDEEGKLRRQDDDLLDSQGSLANSTAVDLTPAQPQQSVNNVETRSEVVDKDRLHIGIPSDSSPIPRSETLVDLTPTSETSGMEFNTPVHDTVEEAQTSGRSSPVSQTNARLGPNSSPRSTSSENEERYYALRDLPSEMGAGLHSPFSDMPISPTPSTAESYSHIGGSVDASSDGTLSDLGRSTEGVATPASWSDVGSVISEDAHHHHHHQGF